MDLKPFKATRRSTKKKRGGDEQERKKRRHAPAGSAMLLSVPSYLKTRREAREIDCQARRGDRELMLASTKEKILSVGKKGKL